MAQIDYLQIPTRKDGAIAREAEYHYGTEKDSYSFVFTPRGIQKQDYHCAYEIRPNEKKICYLIGLSFGTITKRIRLKFYGQGYK